MIVGLVIALLLAKAAAAMMFGLWWGERGRRLAAERMLTAGTSDRPAPRKIGTQVPSEEMVQRVGRPPEMSDSMMERATTRLMEESEAEGIKLTPDEARQQVSYMLAQVTASAEDELDMPGPHQAP